VLEKTEPLIQGGDRAVYFRLSSFLVVGQISPGALASRVGACDRTSL
jgi:hypothetical protein